MNMEKSYWIYQKINEIESFKVKFMIFFQEKKKQEKLTRKSPSFIFMTTEANIKRDRDASKVLVGIN